MSMSRLRPEDVFAIVLFALIVVVFLTYNVGVIFGAWSNQWTMSKQAIADCADIERPELRETSGNARFRVTFKDGEWQEITCLTQSEEDKAESNDDTIE